MHRPRGIIFFAVLAVSCPCLAQSSLHVQTDISSKTAVSGQPVTIAINVIHADRAAKTDWRLCSAMLTKSRNILLYTSETAGTKHTIVFTAMKPQNFTVPALPVLITRDKKTDTVYTKPAQVKFSPEVLIKDINALQPPAASPFIFNKVLIIKLFVIALILAAFLLLLRLFLNHSLKRKNRDAGPREFALRQLQDLEFKLTQGEKYTPQLAGELFGILRGYMTSMVNVIRPDACEQEMIQRLSETGLSAVDAAALRDILQTTQRLRFTAAGDAGIIACAQKIKQFISGLEHHKPLPHA